MALDAKIVFSIAGNFWTHLAVAISSITERDTDCDFVVFYEQEDNRWQLLIEKMVVRSNNRIEFRPFNLSLLNGIEDTGKLGMSVYYRLFIPEILADCNRVVHLDSDILVRKSIKTLCNWDLQGKSLAATPNFEYPLQVEVTSKLSWPLERPYFNAGIQVIDTKLWRERNVAHKALEFLKTQKHKLSYAEQCALNFVLNGDFSQLPPEWNLSRTWWEPKRGQKILHIPFEALEKAREDPSLVHFIGPSKPWHFSNQNPWKSDYLRIRNQFHFFPYFADDVFTAVPALIKEQFFSLPKRAFLKVNSIIRKASNVLFLCVV
jgi:lipopolysaccharide biosynthesis glycosyltransferase